MDQAAGDDPKDFLSTAVRTVVVAELAPFNSDIVEKMAEMNRRLSEFQISKNHLLNVIDERLDIGTNHSPTTTRIESRSLNIVRPNQRSD